MIMEFQSFVHFDYRHVAFNAADGLRYRTDLMIVFCFVVTIDAYANEV